MQNITTAFSLGIGGCCPLELEVRLSRISCLRKSLYHATKLMIVPDTNSKWEDVKHASLACEGGEDEQVRLGGSHPGPEAAVETQSGAPHIPIIC